MSIKLSDAELKVMDILWNEGAKTAKEIREILGEQLGWHKNATYTIIKKCIEKGAIERREPNFECHPIAERSEVLDEFIDKVYGGSVEMLFASLLGSKKLPENMLDKLKQIVSEGEET